VINGNRIFVRLELTEMTAFPDNRRRYIPRENVRVVAPRAEQLPQPKGVVADCVARMEAGHELVDFHGTVHYVEISQAAARAEGVAEEGYPLDSGLFDSAQTA